MKVFKDFSEIKYDPNTVITVGTFDGVHRGHLFIINHLLEVSQKENLRAILITLDPHPQIILQKKDKPQIKLLSNIHEKVDIFRRLNIPNLFVMPFSYEFSQTPADEFLRDYLFKKIGMKKMLVGYDHMFGKNRSGDTNLLENLSLELGFGVERMDALQNDDIVISSTKIRNALQTNNIEQANEMLGYDYCVYGTVVPGDSRGKQIGFPTANILPPDSYKLLPANGVYFVSCEIEGKKVFGMANIGTRPTFTNDLQATLEVHFFDYNNDLYGKNLIVVFHKFIRLEKKFSGIDELVNQIKADEVTARKMSVS